MLFPTSGPLSFVTMVIFCPLPKSARKVAYMLVITDRFSKGTRVIPFRSFSAEVNADSFLEYWVCSYGIPVYLLIDNGPQFAAMLFAAISERLAINQLSTVIYHPQTDGRAERFNNNICSWLYHYNADHQGDEDAYVSPLTYAYHL